MAHGKPKADLDQIRQDLKPYVRKELFTSYIEEKDIPAICRYVLAKYSNVHMSGKVNHAGKAFEITIRVEKFLLGGELCYEVRETGKKSSTNKAEKQNTDDSLEWIDRIEEWDALFYD